jgi:hypothetical protein
MHDCHAANAEAILHIVLSPLISFCANRDFCSELSLCNLLEFLFKLH